MLSYSTFRICSLPDSTAGTGPAPPSSLTWVTAPAFLLHWSPLSVPTTADNQSQSKLSYQWDSFPNYVRLWHSSAQKSSWFPIEIRVKFKMTHEALHELGTSAPDLVSCYSPHHSATHSAPDAPASWLFPKQARRLLTWSLPLPLPSALNIFPQFSSVLPLSLCSNLPCQ